MRSDGRQTTGSSSGDSMKSEASKGSQGSKGSKGSKSSNECTKVDINQAFEALMVIHCNFVRNPKLEADKSTYLG